jgi:hypothetical protein
VLVVLLLQVALVLLAPSLLPSASPSLWELPPFQHCDLPASHGERRSNNLRNAFHRIADRTCNAL